MSLVVSWIGVDTHGITSAYIASDSRVSWGNTGKYDCCRKVFYIKNFPEIIAYCGDVLFPSMLINSIIDCIEQGMIFSETDIAIKRFEKFKKVLFEEFHKYPKEKVADSVFEFLYINKENTDKKYPNYYGHLIKWNKNSFSTEEINFPKKSGILHIMGSGKKEFREEYEKFQNSKSKGTSRNVFQCFATLLPKIKNDSCGGAPQLVGLYRKPLTKARAFGIIYQRKRYYNGIYLKASYNDESIDWRNKYFECCSGKTKQRKKGSQNQSNDIQQLNLATP